MTPSLRGLLMALVALLITGFGLLGPGWGFLSPLSGLQYFLFGLSIGGLLSLGAGLFALYREGREAILARVSVGVGCVLVLIFLGLTLWASRFPAIHDVTTNPGDAPAFESALDHPDNEGRELIYPDGGPDVPRLQRSAYPDIVPIDLEVSRDRALDEALSAANRLGWTMMDVKLDRGHFEAWDKSSIFGFVDDVAVRVKATPTGSRVDVRSTSRLGRGDVGANARRIRRFRAELLAGLAKY